MSRDKTVLRLNTQAMRALFPEDSEARLDLQRNVMHAVVDKVVVTMMDAEVRKQVQEIVREEMGDIREMARNVIRSEFNLFWNKTALKDGSQIKKAIREEVERRVKSQVEDLVKTTVDEAIDVNLDESDLVRRAEEAAKHAAEVTLSRVFRSSVKQAVSNMGLGEDNG